MLAALLVFSALCAMGWAQDSKPAAEPGKTGAQGLEARGKYLVENVAVCAQCHTPRTAAGDLDHSRWLEGAALWLKPAAPSADWPVQAPRIAGTPPGTDAEMVRLLTTGLWRDGKPLRAPMPQFHMTRPDARAVVAYLQSLNPAAR